MGLKHTHNAKRVTDINGRITTVYTRPESNLVSNRLQTVAPPSLVVKETHELNDYADGNYVAIKSANNELEINTAIKESSSEEACLFMVTDSVLDSDGAVTIEGGDKTVLIHLDTLRQAKLTIESGNVIIKTYNERYTPTINTHATSNVTVIISEHCGADITVNEQSSSQVIPEDGAFGTIHVKGQNPVQIHDDHTKHSLLVID